MTSSGPYGGIPGTGSFGGPGRNRFNFTGDGYTININTDGQPPPGDPPRARRVRTPRHPLGNNFLRNLLIALGALLLASIILFGLICLFSTISWNSPTQHAAAPPPVAAPAQPAPARAPSATNVTTSEVIVPTCTGSVWQVSAIGSQAHQHNPPSVPACGYLIAYGDLYENGTSTYLVFKPGDKIQRPNGDNLSGAIYYRTVTGDSQNDVNHRLEVEISLLESQHYRIDPMNGS